MAMRGPASNASSYVLRRQLNELRNVFGSWGARIVVVDSEVTGILV
jgi:hypothetical protein